LALPALCVAVEQQQPIGEKIKGWWNKATSIVPNVPSIIPNPLDAGAAKVAEIAVTKLNSTNWKSILTPGEPKITGEPSEWMIYINGANKTCYGLCEPAEKAWNTSAAVLSALPSGPTLATVDCETDAVLCASWSVNPPAIYHVLLSPTQEPVARYITLNHTSVTATDIVEIHTKRGFEKTEPYTGFFNPWTGLLAKSGLSIPYGYVIWAFALMPSWAPMIILSFLSRTLMSRNRPQGQRAPAPAAAPAPVPAK